MTDVSYISIYLFQVIAFAAALAALKCGMGMLFSGIANLLSRFKIVGRVLFHFADAIFVIAFLTGYLLFAYVIRDGIVRGFDLILIVLFYSCCKLIFTYVFRFVGDILRQIIEALVIKPSRFLHNLLDLAVTRIIRKESSNYK